MSSDRVHHFLPSTLESKLAKALEACCLVLSSFDRDKVTSVSLPPISSMRSLFKADETERVFDKKHVHEREGGKSGFGAPVVHAFGTCFFL